MLKRFINKLIRGLFFIYHISSSIIIVGLILLLLWFCWYISELKQKVDYLDDNNTLLTTQLIKQAIPINHNNDVTQLRIQNTVNKNQTTHVNQLNDIMVLEELNQRLGSEPLTPEDYDKTLRALVNVCSGQSSVPNASVTAH